MQKVTELTEPPIIGEFYWIMCAYASAKWSTRGWVPLLGDLHEDKEIIGFPHHHYHIDHRFISDRELKQIGTTIEAIVSKIVQEREIADRAWKRRKCKRQFLVFPDKSLLPVNPPRYEPIVWMRGLELAYLDKQVNCGRCPHRNIDLRTVQPDGEGNRVCPGHGLRWNREGTLNPRAYQQIVN